MNSYERYLGVLRGQRVDILPRLPILMAFAAKFIDSNYGAFASDFQILVAANLKCAEYFEFDQVSTISDPYRETQGFGAVIEYVKDGVPKCALAPLTNTRDLSSLAKPDPYVSIRMHDRVLAVERYKEQVFEKYSILGWVEGPAAEGADLRGVANFMMDLVEDPEFAGRLMDICVENAVAFAEAQIKAGADTIGIGDAVASQVSAGIYAEMIFPREKILIDAIRRQGRFVRLHICGNITHLLPWIARLEADIVDLDWQVSMAEARRIFGAGTVLVGNLDPVNDVMRGTPQTIAEKVRAVYETVGNRFMVGAGCEVPPGTPDENLKALCRPVEYR